MFRLNIRTDNAAFEGDAKRSEVARILRAIADKLDARDGPPAGSAYDANGNNVGSWALMDAAPRYDLEWVRWARREHQTITRDGEPVARLVGWEGSRPDLGVTFAHLVAATLNEGGR